MVNLPLQVLLPDVVVVRPGGQAVQLTAPADEMKPAGHLSHLAALPLLGTNPALQHLQGLLLREAAVASHV